MDLVKCMIISAAETALFFKLGQATFANLRYWFWGLFAGQFFLLKLYYIMVWPFYVSPLRKLPGPKGGNLILGQALNQAKSLPSEIEKAWMKENPEAPFIRFLSFMNTEYLMVNNTRALRAVLQTKCYSFIKPRFYERVVGEIAGRGLLFMEGEEHRLARKLLGGPFSFGNIKRLLPVFQVKGEETCRIIKDRVRSGKSNVVEVSSLLSKATLDIIGLAALGYELNSLSSSSPLADSFETVFEFSTPAQIVINIVHSFVPIRDWLPTKANKRFVNANKTTRSTLRDLIQRRRSEVADGKKTYAERAHRDLLTLIVEEIGNETSEDDMLGYLLNFVAAGHETTAGSLTWALYALTLHPEMQDRLRSEVVAKTSARLPTYRELEDMQFLNDFTKEVLRYYPPAHSFPREAGETVEIEGVVIPKGTFLWIAPAAPQFNERIWGSSAATFDPDRHQNLPEAAQDVYASQAFSSGPRICIGKSFALLEFKAILAELIRNFKFQNTGHVEPQKAGPSLRPVNGMHLRMEIVDSSAT